MSRYTFVRSVNGAGHGLHLFRNRKAIWHMIREVFRGHYRMSLLTIIISLACIAYALFPFDLLPDYIPVLGWIDDGLLLYLLVRQLGKETMRYNRHKAMERKHLP